MASNKLFFRKKRLIPIFNATLWVVVADNVRYERERMEDIFGEYRDDADYVGLCSDNGGGIFAVFFLKEAVGIKLVSHEVFHLTHRILEWVAANFDDDHHEQGALLNEYLMDLVWRDVSKFGKS